MKAPMQALDLATCPEALRTSLVAPTAEPPPCCPLDMAVVHTLEVLRSCLEAMAAPPLVEDPRSYLEAIVAPSVEVLRSYLVVMAAPLSMEVHRCYQVPVTEVAQASQDPSPGATVSVPLPLLETLEEVPLLSKSTFTSTCHHQSLKTSDLNASSQWPQLRNTTKSSSLRPHQLQLPLCRPFLCSLRTKRKRWCMFW